MEHEDDDNYIWHGDILGEKGNIIGTMSYIVTKGSKYGTIKLEDKMFRIQDIGSDRNGIGHLQAILEMDEEKLAEQECTAHISDDEEKSIDMTSTSKQNCSGTPVIKILVLYTQNAQNTGFNPNSEANQGISDLNMAIRNSGITASELTFELAGVVKLNGFSETSNIQNDRDRLRDNTNTAQNLRNQYNADLVILYADNSNYTAGGTADINTNANPDLAYGIVKINQSPKTFEHEVGHLLGGRHENATSGYERGYSFFEGPPFYTGRKTIMHQNLFGSLDHFSNPSVNFNGVPTGISNSRDVVRRIKANACAVSQFRTEPVSIFSVFFGGPTKIYDSYSPFTWCPALTYGCNSTVTNQKWSYSNDGFYYYQFSTYNCGSRYYTGFSSTALTVYVKYTATCIASGAVASRIRGLANTSTGGGYGYKRRLDGAESTDYEGFTILPELEGENIQVSKNPSEDQLLEVRILLDNERILSFSIWDSTGRKVKTFDAKSYNIGPTYEKLATHGLNDGLYYLNATGSPEERAIPFLIRQ